jgi:uncharacterized protein YaeQ
MALKATIFKADLSISDMIRNYYHDHTVTLARHPSETDERMMVRLLVWALHAHDDLLFGDKIGGTDEPDLWQRDLTGAIDLWIDLGQPDEKQVRKACGRAKQVFVYPYAGHAQTVWWNSVKASLGKLGNLSVVCLPTDAPAALARLAERTMKLQFTIQDHTAWISDGSETVQVELTRLLGPRE